jgi:FAD synthetase
MKKIMAFGTFDIFHKGHQSYLKQAKRLGDYLVAVVARDRNVKRFKKQEARNREQDRMNKLKLSSLADKVILGDLKNRYAVIEKYRPNIIALGYDQKADLKELKKKLKEFNLKAEIIRLKSYKPEIYKSSKLKRL